MANICHSETISEITMKLVEAVKAYDIFEIYIRKSMFFIWLGKN